MLTTPKPTPTKPTPQETKEMLEAFEPKFLSFIKTEMKQDMAHDLNHVLRVVQSAKALCQAEHAQPAVVIPAAYLHDCFSYPKNHPERASSSQRAAEKAIAFLNEIHYPQAHFAAIRHAIEAHSYSANITPDTLEAKIVQDADRLDALGAIGIARCIQVNTALKVSLYNAQDPFAETRALNDKAYCIDHFYIKLLKLAEKMNTPSAKLEAEKRTAFMRDYLKQLKMEVSIY